MKNHDPENGLLRKFGMTMAAACVLAGGIFFFRQKFFGAVCLGIAGSVFWIARLMFPSVLKPVYAAWMLFARMLSWVNTRIILVVLFYAVFTPAGLVMRVFGIDLLERRNRKDTYWRKKEEQDKDPLNYERRF